MAYLIVDVRPSHCSASLDGNVSSHAASGENKLSVTDKTPTIVSVPIAAGTATLATSSTMLSSAKSVSDTHSTMLNNQLSVASALNQTAKPTSPTKSGSVARSVRVCAKNSAKRASKIINRFQKGGLQSRAVILLGKIETKVPVLSAVSSTAVASTGASSTRRVSDVKVDIDRGFKILPHFFSSNECTFKSLLVLLL